MGEVEEWEGGGLMVKTSEVVIRQDPSLQLALTRIRYCVSFVIDMVSQRYYVVVSCDVKMIQELPLSEEYETV